KAGVDLGALMNSNQADPTQQLRMLMASTDSKVVNYDRVRGVLTTHYAFRIDLERLAKDNKDLRKSLDLVRKMSGTTSFPAEAWMAIFAIDQDGLHPEGARSFDVLFDRVTDHDGCGGTNPERCECGLEDRRVRLHSTVRARVHDRIDLEEVMRDEHREVADPV